MRLFVQLSKEQTVGSCTIRCEEYNVDEDGGEEDAGSVDDSKSDVTSAMVARTMKGEEKRGGIAACAVVFSKPSSGM